MIYFNPSGIAMKSKPYQMMGRMLINDSPATNLKMLCYALDEMLSFTG